MTYDLDCSKEIAVRIAKAMANLKALDKIWKSKAITLETKLSILKTCCTAVKHGQLQNAAKAESCPLRENATGRF